MLPKTTKDITYRFGLVKLYIVIQTCDKNFTSDIMTNRTYIQIISHK